MRSISFIVNYLQELTLESLVASDGAGKPSVPVTRPGTVT